MADWNRPLTTDALATFLSGLNGKSVDAAQRFLNDPVNPIQGMVRFARLVGNKIKIQERGPMSWLDRILAVESGGRGEAGAINFTVGQLNTKTDAGSNIALTDQGSTIEVSTTALSESEVDARITALRPTELTRDNLFDLLEAGSGVNVFKRDNKIIVTRDAVGTTTFTFGVQHYARTNNGVSVAANTWSMWGNIKYGNDIARSITFNKQQANTLLRFILRLSFAANTVSSHSTPDEIQLRVRTGSSTYVIASTMEHDYSVVESPITYFTESLDLTGVPIGSNNWVMDVRMRSATSKPGSTFWNVNFRNSSSFKIEERYT